MNAIPQEQYEELVQLVANAVNEYMHGRDATAPATELVLWIQRNAPSKLTNS
jgi:hypothetical protein